MVSRKISLTVKELSIKMGSFFLCDRNFLSHKKRSAGLRMTHKKIIVLHIFSHIEKTMEKKGVLVGRIGFINIKAEEMKS